MANLVYGQTDQPGIAAVRGDSTAVANGSGVVGQCNKGRGVLGISESGQGVWGNSESDTGVVGVSNSGVGIWGRGGRLAGFFEGVVEVTGDIRLTNADFAEDFEVLATDASEPGTVMVIDAEGVLRPSERANDKRVAGVLSGAGTFKPGIILDRHPSASPRLPVALVGKVYCKVDAGYGPIEVGDLLTTSDTPGHAMKATDPFKAFGSVIGKALRPLADGRGLIPVLVALQ